MSVNVAIGVQDFSTLIENHYFYVDKTTFLKEWWDSGDSVTLITRPRRFGKTLTMSMTEQFFSMEYAGRSDLFEELEIWNDEKYRNLQGTYPVISLSFANIKEPTYELTQKKICDLIAQLYFKFDFITESNALIKEEVNLYKKIMNHMDYVDATLSLNYLSGFLYKYYGKKVIILLDEYDTPMQEAFVDGYWDELVTFTRSLFNSTFKTNPALERGIMTGITRVSKESIFSDLNNLKVVTTTSDEYATTFGFTEPEVFEALGKCGLDSEKSEVKRWYDGYVFGRTEVYNPWSVLNYVELIWADMTSLPRPFWANTSSNSIVKTLVEKADIKVKQEIELLIQGESIEKPIHEDITYEDIGVEESEENIWNFLFFTGYLKKVDEALRDGIRYISMSIPNEEILYIYKNTVLSWFGKKVKKKDFSELYRYVTEGEVIGLEKTISELLREGISFYDTKEAFYHGFLMGIFGGMGDYYSYSNRESGDGRYDICLKSMDVEKPVILFELKVSESFHQMEKCSLKAVEQIRMKHYEEEFLRDGYREVLCYGIAFYKKNCKITVEKQKIES